MSVQTIHFLRPPPKKKSTYEHFWSAKNPYENNKNQAKKLIVQKKCRFSQTHPPPNVYGLYTREYVDIYGRPLIVIRNKTLNE